ncbi:NACHT domain-containing protein [Actinoplanes sp. NPDC023714]|uniref:NACHT domain-containing protein n=1 Tax=Actinoplanes sp. NPDC023714 TaxID=3154322 RepID=UPI00340CEDC8
MTPDSSPSLVPSPGQSGGPTQILRDLGVPGWVISAVVILIAVGALYTALKPLWEMFRSGRGVLGRLGMRLREHKRAVRRRQLFADHIDSRLRRISEKEDWRDDRFAELEAEVEMEGEQRHFLRLFRRPVDGPRRVKSLSNALERSTERLVLLQGEPGSGKSVALRHLAGKMARRAMRDKRLDSRIPIYINLKEFVPAEQPVTAAHVREFVLASLNKANSRDIAEFLDSGFDTGMREGTWFFLFDSFDEIPEVLSSTSNDGSVELYADALYDFLHSANTSRGVVASREFRGPRRYGWPRFTILRLSNRQKLNLVRRSLLNVQQEEQVMGGLAAADSALREFSDNPMLLGLLCLYVKNHGGFPEVSHMVFEDYVESRLKRDASRLAKRFDLDAVELRTAAEEVAFCIASIPALGLSPARSSMKVAVESTFGDRPRLEVHLAALEFVRLANIPESEANQEGKFTFSHRRFQEYFATCVVLREPDRVSVDALLLDGKWRETAVALLQTQDSDAVSQLINAAERILTASIEATPEEPFSWPPHSLHLMGLLMAGRIGGGDHRSLSPGGEAKIAALLGNAIATARRLDQKWAVESATLAPDAVRDELLIHAAESRSLLLQQCAFEQAGRVHDLPNSIAVHIRKVLVGRFVTGELRRDAISVKAFIRRLREPQQYIDAIHALHAARNVEVAMTAIVILTLISEDYAFSRVMLGMAIFSMIGFVVSFQQFCRNARIAATVPYLSIAKILGAPPERAHANDLWLMLGLRAFSCMLPVIVIAARPDRISVRWLAAGLFLYLAAWPLCAVFSVSDGRSVRPLRWPAIPFLVLAGFIRQWWSSAYLVGLAVYAVFIALVWTWNDDIGEAVDNRFTDMLFDFTILGMGVVVGYLLYTRIWSHYLRRFWNFHRHDRSIVDGFDGSSGSDPAQLRVVLSELRTDLGLRELITRIRRNGYELTVPALAVLSEFCVLAVSETGSPDYRYLDSVDDKAIDDITRLLEERLAIQT